MTGPGTASRRCWRPSRNWRVARTTPILLDNAVKFTDQGGVSLKVGRDGRRLCFQVEDPGEGMAQEDLDGILPPFRQLGDQSQRPEGAGRGLAITRRLVNLMEGEIRVSSEPGQGSVFTVWLPLDRAW